jgi:peptide/nickel transport system ATP-binding protein
MTENLLSVKNLGIRFRTNFGLVEAVKDISFTLERGEILGIVGESGSGKTVTCRAILGLLPKNALTPNGNIRFADQDILALPEEKLTHIRGEKISMIFQTPTTYLDPLMKVGEQIGESLRFHLAIPAGERMAHSIALLENVQIVNPAQRVHAYPHELSGGMKQRVMIAAALACQPAILIADEPTTALDVTVQAGILKLLKQLRDERGLAIILVSHDLGVVSAICDRVVVMKDGYAVETGTKRDILLNPRAGYTRLLIASHPSLDLSSKKIHESLSIAGTKTEILRVDGLNVTFGDAGGLWARLFDKKRPVVRAVNNVSFSLEQGETLGIVGESGSGKSTIARAIVRLVQPISGTIVYKGHSLDKMVSQELRAYRHAVQMVFQDPTASLNPRMTVEQTLSEPLRKLKICPPGEVTTQVTQLMESVELSKDLLARRPHEISGGQCQRVAIARALSVNPEVLIADEVTSSMDVTIQAQILALLKKLRDEMNLSIIIISHDLGVIQQLCRNIAVMYNGNIVEYGPADQVIKAPKNQYTRQLIEAVPHMPVAEVV